MSQHRPPIVRANILRGFEAFVQKRGISADPLFAEAGLTKPAGDHFERELPFDRVAQLMECAATALEDEDFGLSYACAYPVGGTGLFAFLFLNSGTVEDALRTVVRYVPLLRIPFKFSFETTAEGAKISWRPVDALPRRYQQIYVFGAALLMTRLRGLLSEGWQPVRVELQTDAPITTAAHHAVFGPNIIYSTLLNSVVVDGTSLAQPVQKATPELRALLERYGEHEIAGLLAPDDALIEATRESIYQLLDAEQKVTLEGVAAGMLYAPRKLQSRLAAMATSFEEVLNDARKTRAEQLLKSGTLSLTEIAYRLGFSELSAFTRASQRWFNRSPSAQRQFFKTSELSRLSRKPPRS